MKKALIIIGVVLVLGLAYYAISPLFKNKTLDEAVPENVVSQESTDQDPQVAGEEVMPSGAEELSSEERADMEAQTAAANETPMPPADEQMPEAVNEVAVQTQANYSVMGTIGHPASGSVQILQTTDGSAVIRYENLDTINGPNLHVYLAKDLDAKEYIDLGPIKATDGNINYTVPAGVDVSEYRYVMHWCVPFRVLFNYAELN